MQRKIITLFLSFSVLFGQTLSVDECVRIALENKAAVKRAEQDTKIAQLNRVSAIGMLLPTVRASNSFSETTYGNSSLSTSENYGAGISLNQNLFNSGNNARNVRQSNNNYLIAKENERQSKSRIISNVYTYYYQFLKNKELFTIAEKNLFKKEELNN